MKCEQSTVRSRREDRLRSLINQDGLSLQSLVSEVGVTKAQCLTDDHYEVVITIQRHHRALKPTQCPPETRPELIAEIKRLLEFGYRQADVARHLGVSQSWVSKINNGKIT